MNTMSVASFKSFQPQGRNSEEPQSNALRQNF